MHEQSPFEQCMNLQELRMRVGSRSIVRHSFAATCSSGHHDQSTSSSSVRRDYGGRALECCSCSARHLASAPAGPACGAWPRGRYPRCGVLTDEAVSAMDVRISSTAEHPRAPRRALSSRDYTYYPPCSDGGVSRCRRASLKTQPLAHGSGNGLESVPTQHSTELRGEYGL